MFLSARENAQRCAADCAPYVHAKLQAVHHEHGPTGRYIIADRPMTEEEWIKARAIASRRKMTILLPQSYPVAALNRRSRCAAVVYCTKITDTTQLFGGKEYEARRDADGGHRRLWRRSHDARVPVCTQEMDAKRGETDLSKLLDLKGFEL